MDSSEGITFFAQPPSFVQTALEDDRLVTLFGRLHRTNGKGFRTFRESEYESTDDSTDDETTGDASCLAAKLTKPRKVVKMILVALLVLGTGLYIANIMKSPFHS